MNKNPFDISFGKKLTEAISTILQTQDILSTFAQEPVATQVYMIIGLCEYGKAVFMNTVANTLEGENDWIVVRLNPDCSILQSLGAKKYRKCLIRKGIVNGEEYGHLKFTLPLFREYVMEQENLFR